MSKSDNRINLLDEITSVETNALNDEKEYARNNYRFLDNELKDIESRMLYPGVSRFECADDYESRSALFFQKNVNNHLLKDKEIVEEYCKCDKLYEGHVQLQNGADYFIIDKKFKFSLSSKSLSNTAATSCLINSEDAKYQYIVSAWRFPNTTNDIQYSRNVTMRNKQVINVDIILDKGSETFSEITDSYLRKALIRNKSKKGIVSIIQTIQQEQYDIRSLPAQVSLIVQGCAGSGKTMVLLHRLRYLLYNHFIDNDAYILLVPSLEFKDFIHKISKEFGISVKQIMPYQLYYQSLVERNSKSATNFFDEQVFPPEYLQSAYSKSFMQHCYQIFFDSIIAQSNELISLCNHQLSESIEFEQLLIDEECETQQATILTEAKEIAEPAISFTNITFENCEDIPNYIDTLTKQYKSAILEYNTDSNLFNNKYKDFDESTIRITCERLNLFWKNASKKLKSVYQKKANIHTHLASHFSKPTSKLNDFQIAVNRMLQNIEICVSQLLPCTEELEAISQYGSKLLNQFKSLFSQKDFEDIWEKHDFFHSRTILQARNFSHRKLFNICKQTLQIEFHQKPAKPYKHYWYLSLYSKYLIEGNNTQTYSYIFADEAQDLSISEIELIQKLNIVKVKNGKQDILPVINLFGDINQVISNYGIQNWRELSFILEYRTLNENFRNPNQIVDFCNKKLPFSMQKVGVDMDDVSEYVSLSQNIFQTATDTPLIFIVKDDYAKIDFDYTLKRLSVPQTIDIQCYTVKSVKGLEFKEIFVIDYNMTPNETYIAYTRALIKLNVIHDMFHVNTTLPIQIFQENDD